MVSNEHSPTRKFPWLPLSLALVLIIGALTFAFIQHRATVLSVQDGDGSSANPKSLDGQIYALNGSIKANPKEVQNYIKLSQAYLQKVRETADTAFYEKISVLMDEAEKIDPQNADIKANRASVEIGRHHFKEGSAYASQAIALNPNDHLYYGLLGDAEIELGQYKEAVAAFQKMTDLRPDYSAYIRIAYARELYGDIAGAKTALKQAISAGSTFKENNAFAYVELGKLDMRESLDKAELDFNDALRFVSEYPPALEGLGKISFFKKDNAKAEDYFNQAYTKLPIVQYAVDLGDLYAKEGDTAKAKQYYTLAQLAFQKSAKSGVATDLEESLFLSDHDLDLPVALTKAQNAYIARPSIYAADYLSWALYKNGKIDEVAKYKSDALRLGENDPLILFHQGMILLKSSDKAEGKRLLKKSLELNPYFSLLQSDVAKTQAESL